MPAQLPDISDFNQQVADNLSLDVKGHLVDPREDVIRVDTVGGDPRREQVFLVRRILQIDAVRKRIEESAPGILEASRRRVQSLREEERSVLSALILVVESGAAI